MKERGTKVIQRDQWKDTKLDDSAEIYKQRELRTEKQKLSNMTFQEKVEYFNSYYRNKVIAIMAFIGILIYFAYTIFSPKAETIFYAAVINNTVDAETASTLQDDFSNYLNRNVKTQDLFIDTSFRIQDSNLADQYALANEQKLTTLIATGEIDVVIAPETLFKKYADTGLFVKLSDQLSTEMCSYFADSFYYAKPEGTVVDGAYGVYIDDSLIYKDKALPDDRPVLGILVNSKHKDNVIEFIKYIFALS
ncbi:MAG: hypothetical protein K0R92_2777 [Lachnospiraceae bacterium]|jgi:hypothetical protein|nr:hypothetical protein [Lachnospiraceae bacterium]